MTSTAPSIASRPTTTRQRITIRRKSPASTPTAQRWWDPHGEFRPLHVLNPVRLDYVDARALAARQARARCGLRRRPAERSDGASAAQRSPASISRPLTIEVAELHALESGVPVRYARESAETHATRFSRRSTTSSLAWKCSSTFPSRRACCAHCTRSSGPAATVFVSTLNRNLKSYLLAIVGAEYVLNLLARGTHTYERFIKPSELARWARAAGLDVVDIAGLDYDPLQNSHARARMWM